MNAELIIQRLTQDNMALAEALGQSAAARGRQMDRIAALENRVADLERENAALQGARRVLLTLTDRGDAADGYSYDDALYDTGAVWVQELEQAG
jgi:hypothetical protein